MQARKQDTREKIQLGGLIVKAGLREENKSVILGMLLDAITKMQADDSATVRENYRKLGDEAFLQHDEEA
jgi:hypothetical protein